MSEPAAQKHVAAPFAVDQVRRDFPILARTVHGKPLSYLDNAASAQKPKAVLNALSHCYHEEYANVHRGLHYLSERSTEAYERARGSIQSFLNAASEKEIVFVRGTTEAINLVADSLGRSRIGDGDEFLITQMEHHSNIVPWQMLCERIGAKLRYVPIDDQGTLIQEEYERLLSPRTRLLAITQVSNALGTINALEPMIARARECGALVLVDGAQAVPHFPVDVQALDCDFYAFSGHKLFGPTGIGVLYGRESLLEQMTPYQGGGDMIRTVTMTQTTYNDLPWKFEAGTPHIAGVIGLGAAVGYLRSLDSEALQRHEAGLLEYATQQLRELPGVRLIGTAPEHCSLISFVLDGVHAHDLGTILDTEGIACRAGHHCCMPVMQYFQIPATVRASFSFYNTFEEVDRLVQAVRQAKRWF